MESGPEARLGFRTGTPLDDIHSVDEKRLTKPSMLAQGIARRLLRRVGWSSSVLPQNPSSVSYSAKRIKTVKKKEVTEKARRSKECNR